jgi:hypothetical protein
MSDMPSAEPIVFDGLREVAHTEVHFEKREGVGTSVVFKDQLFDSEGNEFGTAEGLSVVYADAADGTMRQICHAVDHLPDGTISWSGDYSVEALGEEMSVPAVGTSGRYRGMTGRRYFQFVERPDEWTTIFRSRIVLNAPDDEN